MTDGRLDDGNYLVLVRAQVMIRDDSSGGWVPMEGGGLSNVSVRKRILPSVEDAKHEYLICGKRISDQMVVLSCTIKKDFVYNKVMPTFHHWRTGNKKFGLTFQTAHDARAFDKGVRVAVEDLLEGTLESSHIHDSDVGDDDVFMAVDLPAERGDSQSSSGSGSVGGGSSGGGGTGGGNRTSLLGVNSSGVDAVSTSPYTHPHANQHLHRMHYIPPRPTQPSRPPSNNNNGGLLPEPRGESGEVWVKHEERPRDKGGEWDKIEIISEPYSYVHFAPDRPSVHEYSYPVVDALKGGTEPAKKDGDKKLKGDTGLLPPPRLPTKPKWKRDKREKLKGMLQERVQCKYCQELFNEEDNERGSCQDAPDCTRSCIDTVTCLGCAQCMLYHCMSDAEGEFAHHPCSCDRQDEHCGRRWLGLTILSFFVPCLWCYLPMSTCHRCGKGYGLCGGRHEAS